MTRNILSEYNYNFIINKFFDNYNIYMYRTSGGEFFVNTNFKLIYIINGSLSLNIQNKKLLHLHTGDICFIGPGLAYEISKNSPLNTSLILDVESIFFKEATYDHYKNSYSVLTNTRLVEDIAHLMGSLYLENFDKYRSSTECNELISKMFTLIRSGVNLRYISKGYAPDSIEDSIFEIIKKIYTSFLKTPKKIPSLEDLSEAYKINYFYLSKRFKDLIGINYTDYVLKLRLNSALRLLLNTSEKIYSISDLSGFNNSNDLIYQFKKFFSTTPSKFRKLYKDYEKIVFKDAFHQEKDVKDFLKAIEKTSRSISTDVLKHNYSVNTKSKPLVSDLTWNNVIDLNNIIDINKNLSILPQVFSDSFFERIIINIKLSPSKLYLIDKDQDLVELSIFNLKYILEELNRSNIKVSLIFNYSMDFSKPETLINKDYILNLIDVISGLIGKQGLKNYRFGLNIINIKGLLTSKTYNLLANSINNFKNILREKLYPLDLTWILYLNDLEKVEDIRPYKFLISQLRDVGSLPSKYVLNFNYNHTKPRLNEAISYFESLVDKLVDNLYLEKTEDFIIGFNYDLSSITPRSDLVVFYITLFYLELSLSFKSKGYKFSFLSYLLLQEDYNKLRFSKYTHNPLGIKTMEYYLRNITSSLGKDLIFMDNGSVITKEKDDLFILLYDNFLDYYDYILPNNPNNINVYTYYDFIFKGLSGRYKLIEYTFDITKNKFDIADDYMIYISDADKKYLEKNSMPYIDVYFENVKNNSLSYAQNRRLLEIKYIKIQKI